MKRRRRTKRTYTPEFKAKVVALVLKSRANRTKTQRAIANELGITETRLSDWVRLATRRASSRLPPPTRPPPRQPAEPESPTIELRGLRAWVNEAVRVELERILGEKGKR